MKRTLAITAVAAVLALSLAACGAERGDGAMSGMDSAGGTTATDTMRNGDGQTGTGTAGGATANTDTANGGLGGVTGAINGGRDSTRRGNDAGSNAVNNGGHNATYGTNAYTASNNGGVTAETRYKLMMENARVHDRDGFLLDGENSSYRTF